MGVCPDIQPKSLNSLNIDGAPSKYTPVRSIDLHDDIAVNIKYHVNEKVNGNTLFALPEMSIDFVLKQLRSMPNSKSTGLDGIGVSTLKWAAPAIADSITYICNLSIKTQSFPEK